MSDPRFPDRPETKDFKRLSMVVVANDAKADRGVEIPEIVGEVIDLASVLYMAEHRVQWMATQHGITPSPSLWSAYVALWLDAFTAGAKFQEAGGHR